MAGASKIKSVAVSVDEAKSLISELCLLFYGQGWVSGTGGGISVKASDGRIVMAPSGVQKERMEPEDMFVLDAKGTVSECPAQKPGAKPPKLSECSPLFMAAYELRGAGAVMHSHALESVLATMLDENSSELHVTNLEMIKGVAGHGYYDDCVIPIIENTAREAELEQRLRDTIAKYPKTNAVLVRRHGVYIWGDTWVSAKTQAECYHYLFSAAVRMRQMGVDPSVAPQLSSLGEASRKRALEGANGAANGTAGKRSKTGPPPPPPPEVVVLDIEGTTTPITFVADKLFPYARDRVAAHLEATWGEAETKADVEALRQQAAEDLAAGMEGAAAIPAKGGAAAIRAACVRFVQSAIAADRKVPALKGLQGHMWRAGFQSGELVGEVYEDVVGQLEAWRAAGVRVYIYSSGSREAQALLFGYSNRGDLRRFLSGYFDPTATRGTKQEAASYRDIALSVGTDPARILFLTDVAAEAQAAREAGWQAGLLVRPGNKPLPKGHGIDRVVASFAELAA